MAKAVKKKTRRLKKTVRKTLGTLFLISAIIVAAIPVENLQAYTDDSSIKVGVTSRNCNIPDVGANELIYTTGDGQYQFAYVTPNSGSVNKVAVILGYNGGYLEGNALTIPESLDAYLKYSDNQGTSRGYVAVSKSNEFLFYETKVQATDAQGNLLFEEVQKRDDKTNELMWETNEDGTYKLDENNNKIPINETVPVMKSVYNPCRYEDYALWSDLKENEFYYYPNNNETGTPSLTTQGDHQRITGAEVWYIGNQYLVEDTVNDVGQGTWHVAGDITDSSHGIFAGEGNIRSLKVGDKLSGIGNYAFYGCSGLNSITLGNGLDTIGNHAFDNCINITTVNLDLYSRVSVIGAYAFRNCRALQKFTVPISVTQIGDHAFEDCIAMTHIELCGEGKNVSLAEMGPDVLKGCTSLESVTFPQSFSQTLDISMFQGCTSLAYISTSNESFVFTDNNGLTFEQFKAAVPEEFYFEGPGESSIHTMATRNFFAFKYEGQELYEITQEDGGVYRVNDKDELVYCRIDGIADVTMPNAIGPYHIRIIDSGTFQNKCVLKKITIPASVTEIRESAFKGCHNLENVIFLEPTSITTIGSNAFKTQEVAFHDGCDTNTLDDTPVLKFTGPISYKSAPFVYAMDPGNNINFGTQPRTYITYYSGWPTNLEVQYNPDTDKNELVDYPTFRELEEGSKYTAGTVSSGDGYAYITTDYMEAAKEAVSKYNSGGVLTDYERQIIDSALNIVLPEGIESIKENLFVEKEGNESTSDKVSKTITAYSLNEVAGGSRDSETGDITGGAFSGFKNLTEVYLLGDTETIGDYAFYGCENLVSATLPSTVTTMGIRPFAGCEKLKNVNFVDNPNFSCDNSIIYGLDADGNKKKVVEYLEGRESGVVMPEEMAGVTEIAQEAFMGTNVSKVDLEQSSVGAVPQYAFADTPRLFEVDLPDTCKSISAHAFENSGIQYAKIPQSVVFLDNSAFDGVNLSSLLFYCEPDSTASIYADEKGIKWEQAPVIRKYTVTFWDSEKADEPMRIVDTQTVIGGEDAVPPEPLGREGYVFKEWSPDYHAISRDVDISAQYVAEDPDAHKFTVTFLDWDDTVIGTRLVLPGGDAEPPVVSLTREGYRFTGWRPAVTNIQADTIIYAQYEKIDTAEAQYTVRFLDHDDTVLKTDYVMPGQDADPPAAPSREGYIFSGWRPSYTNIQTNTDIYAQYEKIDTTMTQLVVRFFDYDDTLLNTQRVNYGEDAIPIQAPTREGYTFVGWKPAITGVIRDMDVYAQYVSGSDSSGNGNGTGSSNNGQNNGKFYTLTVRNGSGSGSYVAGSQPIIVANDPPAGQEFSSWTIDPANTTIASKALSATVITMPEGNVTVTANYKAKTGGSGTTGSSNSGKTPGTTGTVNKGGTTVIIDKNGLSNTGVVSATVNGSSDNFVVKITESSSASEAVVKALMAEYGNDLSNIKYFPMDISLYDSTGKNKITDTTGLSISITLPLPDSLITYAGNNKVAGVVNDRLDKLTPKFTTISGVSCITFTAEHFSPYVIYVDTTNLTAGGAADATPKTGDGIHPKWFLSIGLACVSVVLFMKKDKRTMKKRLA